MRAAAPGLRRPRQPVFSESVSRVSPALAGGRRGTVRRRGSAGLGRGAACKPWARAALPPWTEREREREGERERKRERERESSLAAVRRWSEPLESLRPCTPPRRLGRLVAPPDRDMPAAAEREGGRKRDRETDRERSRQRKREGRPFQTVRETCPQPHRRSLNKTGAVLFRSRRVDGLGPKSRAFSDGCAAGDMPADAAYRRAPGPRCHEPGPAGSMWHRDRPGEPEGSQCTRQPADHGEYRSHDGVS